jgi:hypothetical protein
LLRTGIFREPWGLPENACRCLPEWGTVPESVLTSTRAPKRLLLCTNPVNSGTRAPNRPNPCSSRSLSTWPVIIMAFSCPGRCWIFPRHVLGDSVQDRKPGFRAPPEHNVPELNLSILVLTTIETTILTSKGGQMAAEGRALPPPSVPYSIHHIQSVCTGKMHYKEATEKVPLFEIVRFFIRTPLRDAFTNTRFSARIIWVQGVFQWPPIIADRRRYSVGPATQLHLTGDV